MADVHNQNSLLSLLSMYCHLPVRLWMYIFLIWFPSSSQTTTKMYDPLPVFASLIILHHENITELYDDFMLYSTVPKVKIIFKMSLLFHINLHFFKPL